MSDHHLGSCLCEQVKYEVKGSFDSFFLCHCSRCQKGSGSAHGANLFSAKAKLKWIKGKEKARVFNLAPTRHTKSFCETCGSMLPYELPEGYGIVVPAGGLDSKVTIKPTAHIFYAKKASWEEGLDQVMKFDEFPS